jgi:hypothetical protein
MGKRKIADWPVEMVLRDGTPARYLERDPLSGRHRVLVRRGQCVSVQEAEGRSKVRNADWGMTYHLDDYGICRCDGAEGPFDYVPAKAAA